MDAMASEVTTRAPTHLWIVGVLSLFWNAFGGVDFTMTNLRVPSYLAQLPPDMIDYIDAFPFWVTIAWGIGVWGALLASVLLLARSAWAVHGFALSLAGLAVSTAFQVIGGVPDSMRSASNWPMTGLIWILAIAQLVYAVRMKLRRILR